MKQGYLIKVIGLLCLCMISYKSFAQADSLRFEHFTVQQGLSHSRVICALQDREGFMWFGTRYGLNKYDGYTFTVFQSDPNDPANTLQHNYIRSIHEDKAGKLWVASFGGGLHEVNKRTGKIASYGIQPVRLDLWNTFSDIYEDRNGIFWIGSSKGLLQFNPKTKNFTRYPIPNDGAGGTVNEDSGGQLLAIFKNEVYRYDRQTDRFNILPINFTTGKPSAISSVYLDKEGTLWIGTAANGLFTLNTKTNPAQLTPYNPNGLVHQQINRNGIYEDRKGRLWLATRGGGLQRINKKNSQVITYKSNPAQPGSLNSNDVLSVYEDRTGTLWVGTDNGLNKADAHDKPFSSNQISVFPFIRPAENNIRTVLEDSTGTIWLGVWRKGLYFRPPGSKQIRHIPANPTDPSRLTSEGVGDIQEDRSGRLWIGTKEGLHLLDRATGKFTRYPAAMPVLFISEDYAGKLWVSGRFDVNNRGAIASFDLASKQYKYYNYSPNQAGGLNNHNVYDILTSRTGEVWVATFGGGINRLNPATGKFTYYKPDYPFSVGHLNDINVRTLYEDAQGIIWVGTNQAGLNRFDPRTETFSYFTIREGLPSNQVVTITSDAKGDLWIGTNRGLSRFNPTTGTFHNFDVRDGLPDNECSEGGFYNRKGKLLLGTANGFVTFYPDSIKNNTVVPPVHLTGLKVLEQSRPLPTGHLELPYSENFFSFDFVALNYDSPEKNQYAYQLVGLDKEWIYSGTRRYANYSGLPPGSYTFRVKASNNDGVWNKQGASIGIIINPPWWQTWWAYTIYGLAFTGLIFGFIRLRLQRERERWETGQLKAMDEIKTRFFSNITHEFRTPLSLILSPAEQLLQEVEEPKHQRRLMMIKRHAGQLLQLVNQLLDLSKLEAGNMALAESRGDLSAFTRSLVDTFRPAAEDKGITLHYHTFLEAEEWIFDADKWEKIVNNLLSNALKFTPAGGNITTRLEWGDAPLPSFTLLPTVQRAKLTVQDTGIGIPADKLEHIFDRFYQVDNSSTRAFEGTGIGLSLVKELVDLLHGQITVTSKTGEGTTLIVELPVRKVAMASKVPLTLVPASVSYFSEGVIPPDNALVNPEAPVLLVVDDNADLREFISVELSSAYRVFTAANGEEGWLIVQQELPDVVISDVMMPIMDGYDLTQRIKTDPATNHIAVVLLTAKAAQESKVAGLQQGADDYLTKPFHLNELQLRLRNLLNHQHKLRQYYQQQLAATAITSPIETVQDKFLRALYQSIEEQLDNSRFDVDALATTVALSRRTLYRKLSSLIGLSPNEVIRDYRLKRATQLLKAGHNVSETAYQVGFENPGYFGQCFKEKYQITPSDYLQQCMAQ